MTLPFVDEHARLIDAPPEAVWRALGKHLGRGAGGLPPAFARLIGAEPGSPHGDPTEEGAAITGFSVARAEPPRLLELRGRHRFSEYALTFRLEPEGSGTRLCAVTHAAFPGPHGAVYRALVIGSRVHVLAVHAMLDGVERRAARRT